MTHAADGDEGAGSGAVRHHARLWAGREHAGDQLRIGQRQSRRSVDRRAWLVAAGQAWRRLPTKAQWALAVVAFVWLQNVASPAGVLFAGLMVVFLTVTDSAVVAGWARKGPTPEDVLITSRSIEARVAGAAVRAWSETLDEPSWSSPALAATRATFDGDREVDAIVDLALRIHAARQAVGTRPSGPAADVWRQQWEALDKAALRLGDRADALIRHRDQAAELSRELAQLADLERLERSAVVIDDLTMETAATSPTRDQLTVTDQIVAARRAVAELVDLMTRTRAPLLDLDGRPT